MDAALDLFASAVIVAQHSSNATGPDLNSLKSASLAYENAARIAADRLGAPMAPWPASVTKSISNIRHQYIAELPPLKAMAAGSQMSDEANAYSHFPDSTKALDSSKRIRLRLGVPSSSAPGACPPPSALSLPPAAGQLIAGTGYTFHAPSGWTIPKAVPQADSYVISAKSDIQGVRDTVNVLISASNTDTFDDEEQNGIDYLEKVAGATAIQVRPRVVIAGEEGVHISYLQTHDGTSEWTEQFLVAHGQTAYTITFDFDEAESQTEREALAESVLSSWNWT